MRKRNLRAILVKRGLNKKIADQVAKSFISFGMTGVIEKYQPYLREIDTGGLEGVVKSKKTICEVHRRIYRVLTERGYKENDIVIDLLHQAFEYGKKMNYKLRQYKFNYDKGWYEKQKVEDKATLGNDVDIKGEDDE